MAICPVCDEHNREKNMFCINCGEELIHMDFVKAPGSAPARKQSPRMAPSIRAVAPVSVTSPPPQAEPFSQPEQHPIPTEPAPPFPLTAESISPFDEEPLQPIPTEPAPPFVNNEQSFPEDSGASFPPESNTNFPEDPAASFPDAPPIPSAPQESPPVAQDMPFPDDTSAPAASPAFPDSLPPEPETPADPFPGSDAPSEPTAPAFPDSLPPEPETSADPFPSSDAPAEPTAAETSSAETFPLPEEGTDDSDPFAAPNEPDATTGADLKTDEAADDADDFPFPENETDIADAADPFPADGDLKDDAADAFPFPDDNATPTADDFPSDAETDASPFAAEAVDTADASPFPPVTNDADASPFPPEAVDAADASPFPPITNDSFPAGTPDTESAESVDFPFSEDNVESQTPFPDDTSVPIDTPSASSEDLPFPATEVGPAASTEFPDVDNTAPTSAAAPTGAFPFPDEGKDSFDSPEGANTFPDTTQEAEVSKPQKKPGLPVTGTQIHQAVSVSVPATPSSAPAPNNSRSTTSDALPRPRTPMTTDQAPVQWHSECEMCGFHNEPDAVYCGECGTAIKKQDFSESAIFQRAKLVQVSFDGGETQVYDIDTNGLAIHAETGDIAPLDQYHPNTHAIFRVGGSDIQLTPPKGEHGIFVRIPPKKPTNIDTGNVIRVGHQTLLFEAGSQHRAWGTLTSKPPSPEQRVIPLEMEDMIIGREAGHIQFSDDYLISGTHMRIYTTNGRYLIYDLASTNGTYLQVSTPYHPAPGEVFIIASKIYKTSVD